MAEWLRNYFERVETSRPSDDDAASSAGVLNELFQSASDDLPGCDAGSPTGTVNSLVTVLSVDRFFGVPGNLLINTVIYFGGVLLFSVLRKKAWNYGRLALLERVERAHYFAGRGQVETLTMADGAGGNKDSNSTDDNSRQATLGPEQSRTKWLKSKMFARHAILAGQEQLDREGYFTWIKWVWMLSLTQIGERCGQDAVQYLLFQQYIIFFLFLLTILCICLIMPLNITSPPIGANFSQSGFTGLNNTVIANLHPNTPIIWIHVVVGIFLYAIGLFVMGRYRRKLESIFGKFKHPKSRTVMVEKVPKNKCTQVLIRHYLREAYPTLEIADLRFAYNVRALEELAYKREIMTQARLTAQEFNYRHNVKLTLLPLPFGNTIDSILCFWLNCFGHRKAFSKWRQDAVAYYQKKEMELNYEVSREVVRSVEEPVGIFFVTFRSWRDAQTFYSSVGGEFAFGTTAPHGKSSLSRELRTNRWIAALAPEPTDIKWKNLHLSRESVALKSWCFNVMLFLCLFLLATGQYIWYFGQIFSEVLFSHPVAGHHERHFFIQLVEMIRLGLQKFFPTIILLLMRFLLPLIIYETDRVLPYRTYSSQQHSQMQKIFLYLFITVVFLQAFGFGAVWNWFLYVRQAEGGSIIKWHCMFLPHKGFTFVNYLITACFTANVIELLRVGDLICYVFRMAKARSRVEDAHAKAHLTMEFKYGVQYAWVMLMVTTSIMFSIACPLISLAGLLHMCFKHFTDRYNIYFAYWAVRLEQRTHEQAVSIFFFAIFMQQMSLTTFALLRHQRDDRAPIYVISTIGAAIMGVHLAARMCRNSLKHRAPLMYASLCAKSSEPRRHPRPRLRDWSPSGRWSSFDRESPPSEEGTDSKDMSSTIYRTSAYEKWDPRDTIPRPYVSPVFAALEKKTRISVVVEEAQAKEGRRTVFHRSKEPSPVSASVADFGGGTSGT